MENFGYHLKRLRESRGMTVNQLAMYSQISSASISRYESGERGAPKAENIKKLAAALKMPYEELMRIAGHLDKETKEEVPGEETEEDLKIKEIDRLVRKVTKDMGIEATEAFLKQLAREK